MVENENFPGREKLDLTYSITTLFLAADGVHLLKCSETGRVV